MNNAPVSRRGAPPSATPVRRLSALLLLAALGPPAALAQAPATPSAPAAVAPASGPREVTLREALVLAARQSPDVAAAQAQAEVARAGVDRAWAAWKPEVSASGQFVHTSAPAQLDLGQFVGLVGAVYGIAPVNPGAIPPPVTIVAPNSRYATVQVSQPLFTPQGLFLLGPAKTGSEAAELGAREAREQVLLNVARTYLGLQGVEGLTQAAREAEAVALRREAEARSQIAAGVAVEVALLRAQSETAQARTQLAQLDGQRAQLLAILGALVGEPVRPVPMATAPDLGWDALLEESREPWERTYAVRASAKAVEAAEGVTTYDRFSWLPSVAAVAKGNYNSNAGFSGKVLSYDLILALNVPLYDRGLRYAAARENEARLAQARASLEAARAALAQAEAQAQLAARAQQQVEAAARAGVATNLELSDADTRRFLAQSAAAQARAMVDIRRAELAAAAGQLAELAQVE